MAPPTGRRSSVGALDMDHSSVRHFFGLGARSQQPEPTCIHQSMNDARNSTRRGRQLYANLNSFDDYTSDDANNFPTRTTDMDDANNFPTRATDLRHVDQSINLMDAETANYRAPPSDYVFAMDEDSYGSDDDVYKNYTQGFRSGNRRDKRIRPPRAGSIELIQDGLKSLREGELPRRYSDPNLFHEDDAVVVPHRRQPKHHSMSFLTDMDDSDCNNLRKSLEDSSEWGDILLFNHRRKTWLKRLVWSLVLLLLVGTTVLTIVYWDDLALANTGRLGNAEGSAVEAPPPMNASTMPHEAPSREPLMTPGAIEHRRLVLTHVVAKGLEHHHKGNEELEYDSPAGKKGLEWMTATDEESMKMLDHYHYYHHDHTLQPQPIVSGRQVSTVNKEEMEEDRQILNRYVEVVFYFVQHPDCLHKTCKICI